MAAKSLKKTVKEAARLGEGRDKIMAHLAPGEIVLPLNFQKKFPAVEAALRQSFAKAGINYEQFVAGSPSNKINSRTGAPMFDEGGEGGGGPSDSGTNDSGTNDGNYGGDLGGLETGFNASDDPNTDTNADPNADLRAEDFETTIDPNTDLKDDPNADLRAEDFETTIDPNTDLKDDPNADLRAEDFEPTIDPPFGPNLSPGQISANAFFDAIFGFGRSLTNDIADSLLSGQKSQAATAEDAKSGFAFSVAEKAATSAELAGLVAADKAVADAATAVGPTVTADPFSTMLGLMPTDYTNPEVNPADFFDPVTSNYNVFGRESEVKAEDRDDDRAALTSYLTDPASIVNNSFGLFGPDRGDLAPGPLGNLNLDYTGPTLGYVGTTFSGRQAGDERADVSPTVGPDRSDDRDRAGPSYTEADIAGRTGNVFMGGDKGAVSSGKGTASPGYDISTYITDPYETISGAVQQGDTPLGVDGTPDGGGENVRRRLTEAEIQYLAEMGYLPGEAVPVASLDTVRPSVAPITYDISNFLSRSNR